MNRLLFNAQMAQYATPIVTGESSVVIEDGIKCYLPELKIVGNTTQLTSTGANILDIPAFKLATNVEGTYGWFASKEGDSITVWANSTNTSAIAILVSGKQTITAGKYRMSVDKPLPFQIRLQKSSFLIYAGQTSNTIIYTGEDFVNANIAVDARPQGANPWTYEPITFKLMLQKIDDAAPVDKYEPYTGGKPVPNPEWPTDIVNAGDKGIEVEVRGANLIDYTNKRFSLGGNAGATYSLADDILNIEMSCYYMYFQLPNSTADTYTLLQEVISLNDNLDSTLSMTLLYRYTDGTYEEVSKNLELGKNVLSINKGAGKRGDRLEIRFLRKNNNGSSVATASIKNLMVCEGEILEYEPYVEPQTISIPPSVEVDGETVELKFAKVGDYADKIIVDGVNKTVTYQQNIHEKIFDGTEAISIPTSSLEEYGLSAFRYLDFWKQAAEVFRCNHLIYNNQTNYRHARTEGLYGLTTAGQMFFCISTDRIPLNDTEAFKNHLAEKYSAGIPYVVQYASLTPIETDITDSPLGEQLLALVQNNGTTIIEASNANNLSQTLTAKYLTHV